MIELPKMGALPPDLVHAFVPFAIPSEYCRAALAAVAKKLAEETAAMERAASIGALRIEELAAHLPRPPVPYGPQRKGRGGKTKRW